jgi:hypothetical protein
VNSWQMVRIAAAGVAEMSVATPCYIFPGTAKPGHVVCGFSEFSSVGRVLGSGRVAERAGSPVRQVFWQGD